MNTVTITLTIEASTTGIGWGASSEAVSTVTEALDGLTVTSKLRSDTVTITSARVEDWEVNL